MRQTSAHRRVRGSVIHRAACAAAACVCTTALLADAQDAPRERTNPAAQSVDALDLRAWMQASSGEMEQVVRRYDADRGNLLRTYTIQIDPKRRERMRRYFRNWLEALETLDFGALSRRGQVDSLLLCNLVTHDLRTLEIEERRREESLVHLPFAPLLGEIANEEPGGANRPHADSATKLHDLKKQGEEAKKKLEERLGAPEGSDKPTPAQCKRTLALLESLRGSLRAWHSFRDGYDPMFTWWCADPYRSADAALDELAKTLREKGMGVTAENPDVIVGTPIGREALLAELEFEMIPYTPEELLAIGEREFAWCEREYAKAAAEMGLGDDWRAALERAKRDHVAPGEQPGLIRELAREAVVFLREQNLVTVPPLAEETWHMTMLSPEAQKVSPFFLGGETIYVSFPTSGMGHEYKMMSLRGNNRHFARATVHHELFPGHGLQAFSSARYNTHRAPFWTAFWTEGWALHFEMLFWDRNFAKSPENKVGMLFWRSHRCARIVCSIKYHLGEMSAQEWIDFLVDRVGHERANAEGEVRRSVSGDYGPLYQVAYMIGGLQFRALRKELVESGSMSDRDFHDAVMRENNIPVAMVRALLGKDPVSRDASAKWRFDTP